MTIPSWNVDVELPSLHLWWRDELGDLIDMSTVTGWQLRVGLPDCEAVIEKTSGISGAVGSGVSPTGVPNVVLTWATGELNVSPGLYLAQLKASWGTTDRMIEFNMRIEPAISALV